MSDGKVSSPAEFYHNRRKGKEYPAIAEQIIRPTGLLDPVVEVDRSAIKIPDLVGEIKGARKGKAKSLW